ncbi:carnitine dehydratase [Frankia sp. CcI49]|uniref:CoA transferase n=1 Tax=Frankia sp. CcI49 TaxID=1745382 RepID=UPI00097811A9|nr:CoA transferase [Frankia sp. CcI49]ONH60674.1 carnitine dehydratase [Frankia sp. CcI49]
MSAAVALGAQRPCAGLTVVEVAVGTSDLGLGLAGGVPGMIFADLGARVVRVVGTATPELDEEVAWGQVWHRDKHLVVTDDPAHIRDLLLGADVAIVYGPEQLVEERGLGCLELTTARPGLVYLRCRPSRTSKGTAADFGLLVEARAGFCTQLAGHRPGPIFVDAQASGSGTAFLLITSALALLRRRAATGHGGWAETSLYDGLLATLGCMIGRSERAATEIESYWEKGSTFPNFLYRCADGELLQVWFGGKGMYARLIEVLGDTPSAEGYYADQMTGALNERARRWRSPFALRPRADWLTRLRAAGIACEPVLRPGEALADPHLAEIGLAVPRSEAGHEDVVVGSPISVQSAEPATDTAAAAGVGAGAAAGRRGPQAGGAPGLALHGVRVLDFSAFVAGPLAAQVLADLGADVIKVEPPGGEAMRAAAYAVAACQRGKRSLAMDLGAAETRPVVERLIRWADVVLHNFRVGVAERLRIDAGTVAALNPSAVYCHASAFGPSGPRAKHPGNDALMQALTGLEQAVGGAGNDPVAPTWIPLDITGGWVAAAGILAGLYAREATGRGQRVDTSLLGAGMLLQSGVFFRDGEPVATPTLDAAQTGYGPGYRIYPARDGRWFALVVPDRDAWQRLRTLPPPAGVGVSGGTATSTDSNTSTSTSTGTPVTGGEPLPEAYVPLRGGAQDALARQAEATLEATFATATAAEWVAHLRAHGLAAELVDELDRDGFRRAVLDDPVNRQLGRVASYDVADWGWFEQIGPLLRYGPRTPEAPRPTLPGIGEHSTDILTGLGFSAEEINSLLASKSIHQAGQVL